MEQGNTMRAGPYDAHETGHGEPISEEAAASQRGLHGEGAETIGNSVRGALSGGLSGATTTRSGQQGGIGSSVYDVDPAGVSGTDVSGPMSGRERDLTLGEQYGGTMERDR